MVGLKSLIVGVALSLVATAAVAQSFPTRNITVVVPYAPGSTDTLARILAEGMSKKLGQPVIVETRPGAGGSVGTAFVANSNADGHTILMAVSSVLTTAPHQNPLPYSFTSLTPIARVAIGPNVIAKRKDAPFASIAELVQYAKANPGEVSFGSAGTGGATHIAGEAIAAAAGIELFHIPFDGVTPAITATMAGDVDLVLGYASAILPQSNSGKLVPLAQLAEQRTTLAPDMPTLKESGVDLALVPNIGYWAPAGTPEPVIEALAASIEDAANSKTFKDFGKNSLTEVGYTGTKEFKEVLVKENDFFAKLLPTIKIAD